MYYFNKPNLWKKHPKNSLNIYFVWSWPIEILTCVNTAVCQDAGK